MVHAIFGGETLKTRVPFAGAMAWHFYSRIDGTRFEFAAEQVAQPVAYDDLPATQAETLADTLAEQGAAPAAAFRPGPGS